jgi:HK97 family phage portal protein
MRTTSKRSGKKAVSLEDGFTDESEIVNSLVGVLRANGAKQPPFNTKSAIKSFRSWVYAACKLNAQQVAATPLRLYARDGAEADRLYRCRSVSKNRKRYMLGESDRSPSQFVASKAVEFGDDFVEVVESHPAKDLLRTVNPYLGGFDFITLTMIWLQLTGNAYIAPVAGEIGIPSELWPIPPDMVWAIPGRERLIDGWLVGRSQSEALHLDHDALLHMKLPNPGDLIYGLGVVEAMWSVVKQNEAAHEMDYATFANMARPDYALIVRSGASEQQLDLLEKQLRRKLGGTAKAGQALAMTGDVKLTPLQWSPKDMAGRDEIIEEIAAVTGVPVSMLKANDPNLASASTGFASWKETTILPFCRIYEDFLNQQYLKVFGLENEMMFCFDDPVPSNRTADLAELQTHAMSGLETRNELRVRMLGLEPVDDPMADTLMIGNQPIGYMPEVSQPQPSEPKHDDMKSLLQVARMVDAHNKATGDDATIEECLRAIAGLR